MPAETSPVIDPVRARRAQIARIVSVGQRVGSACFAIALVLGMAGLIVGLSDAVATATVVLLIAGSLVLAPAMVGGYAVRAAERDDVARGL